VSRDKDNWTDEMYLLDAQLEYHMEKMREIFHRTHGIEVWEYFKALRDVRLQQALIVTLVGIDAALDERRNKDEE
jgi:hypothetical protein